MWWYLIAFIVGGWFGFGFAIILSANRDDKET